MTTPFNPITSRTTPFEPHFNPILTPGGTPRSAAFYEKGNFPSALMSLIRCGGEGGKEGHSSLMTVHGLLLYMGYYCTWVTTLHGLLLYMGYSR